MSEAISLVLSSLVLLGIVVVPAIGLAILVKRIRAGQSPWRSLREFLAFLWRNFP